MASFKWILVALVVSSMGMEAGCNTTWRSQAVQPQLTLGYGDLARTSEVAEILLRDMELSRRVFLANSAYFVVVSKDRLRFHVRLVHKWKSIADPARWRVWLEDEAGNKYYPEAIDSRNITWHTYFEIIPHDFYAVAFKVGGIKKSNSTPAWLEIDAVCPPSVRMRCSSGLITPPHVNVWKGDGDYTFYKRDIYKATDKKLTLVMSRLGYTFRYSWKFVPDPELAEIEQRQARANPGH